MDRRFLATVGAVNFAVVPLVVWPRSRLVAHDRALLVILPLALALPAEYDLAPLAVVAQTLVELVCMVAFVRLVPRLIPARP